MGDIFSPLSIGAFSVSAAVAYLLGSISFAIIFSKVFANDDVRNYGSGNAGTTNVFRSIGVVPGILTFFCDFGKGALAILFSEFILNAFGLSDGGENKAIICVAASIAGLFAVLGHLYPLYFNFRGGKGVMTLAGIIFMLSPLRFCVLFGIFLIVFALTRTVSIGSLLASGLYPVATFIECYYLQYKINPELYTSTYVITQTLVAVMFAIMVFIKHKSNIKRIFEGTEQKLVFKRKNDNKKDFIGSAR